MQHKSDYYCIDICVYVQEKLHATLVVLLLYCHLCLCSREVTCNINRIIIVLPSVFMFKRSYMQH